MYLLFPTQQFSCKQVVFIINLLHAQNSSKCNAYQMFPLSTVRHGKYPIFYSKLCLDTAESTAKTFKRLCFLIQAHLYKKSAPCHVSAFLTPPAWSVCLTDCYQCITSSGKPQVDWECFWFCLLRSFSLFELHLQYREFPLNYIDVCPPLYNWRGLSYQNNVCYYKDIWGYLSAM